VDLLLVTSLTLTASGFVAEFSQPLDPNTLNLYENEAGSWGLADVSLVGDNLGPVAGSLIVEEQSATFIATGGPLPADNYTLQLRGSADAFRHATLSEPLDGDANADPGGDFVFTFTAPGPEAAVIGLPDFTRGPGQAVDVPASGSGLPLSVSNGEGIESIQLTLAHDQTRLRITGAQLGPDAPAGAELELDDSVAGRLQLHFTTTTPLGSGPAELVTLTAEVPETATGGAQVLEITEVSVNEGTVAVTADQAVHSVAYFGDTTGNGDYSGLDAVQIARVVVGLDSGFEAHPLIDPVILADITGNGDLSGLDAVLVAQEVVGLDPPEIPPIPTGLAAQNASPLLSPSTLGGVAGSAALPTGPASENEFAGDSSVAATLLVDVVLAECDDRWSAHRKPVSRRSDDVSDMPKRKSGPVMWPTEERETVSERTRVIDEALGSLEDWNGLFDGSLFETDLALRLD
jgi:hypothetical protein